MNKNVILLLGACFALGACNSSDETGFDKELQKSVATDSASTTITAPLVSDSVAAVATMPTPQPEVTTISQSTATAKAGMNPEHGKPGHRCDIAVGAPLNSPVVKPAASTPQAAPVMTSTSPTPDPVVTAPGMNPPHGQPGHDCSIAVGAPLKKN